MKTLDMFLFETEEVKNPKVNVEGFLMKVDACKTVAGCDELEKFYKKRIKEVQITPSEDIQIRDAINGRREELKALEAEAKANEEEKQEDF